MEARCWGQLGPVAPRLRWPVRGSGRILCAEHLSGLGLQTFPHIGKAGNTAAQRLGTWALKSDRHGASQHCLLQAGDLRQIALCMYRQARVRLGIELSRTHKKLPTVVAPGKEDMGWVGNGPCLKIIASEFMPQACVSQN